MLIFWEDGRAVSSNKLDSPKFEIQTVENNFLEKKRKEVIPGTRKDLMEKLEPTQKLKTDHIAEKGKASSVYPIHLLKPTPLLLFDSIFYTHKAITTFYLISFLHIKILHAKHTLVLLVSKLF